MAFNASIKDYLKSKSSLKKTPTNSSAGATAGTTFNNSASSMRLDGSKTEFETSQELTSVAQDTFDEPNENFLETSESEDSCEFNPDFPDCNYDLTFENRCRFRITEDKTKSWPFPPERCKTKPIHDRCTLHRDKCTGRKYFSYYRTTQDISNSIKEPCPQTRTCDDDLVYHSYDSKENKHLFKGGKIDRKEKKYREKQSQNFPSTPSSNTTPRTKSSEQTSSSEGTEPAENNTPGTNKTQKKPIKSSDHPKMLTLTDKNEFEVVSKKDEGKPIKTVPTNQKEKPHSKTNKHLSRSKPAAGDKTIEPVPTEQQMLNGEEKPLTKSTKHLSKGKPPAGDKTIEPVPTEQQMLNEEGKPVTKTTKRRGKPATGDKTIEPVPTEQQMLNEDGKPVTKSTKHRGKPAAGDKTNEPVPTEQQMLNAEGKPVTKSTKHRGKPEDADKKQPIDNNGGPVNPVLTNNTTTEEPISKADDKIPDKKPAGEKAKKKDSNSYYSYNVPYYSYEYSDSKAPTQSTVMVNEQENLNSTNLPTANTSMNPEEPKAEANDKVAKKTSEGKDVKKVTSSYSYSYYGSGNSVDKLRTQTTENVDVGANPAAVAKKEPIVNNSIFVNPAPNKTNNKPDIGSNKTLP
ncbi:unnamed protein product [Allacma fusca]|uniref:Uncharacterized protein n=1 Tax=Allacma fusca TaxID=39272 RepID=A0A8J2PTM5_9HEXA|nr:unnamed protein product [Allacma fusca]